MAILLGLGVVMPLALLASGVYAIHAEEVAVPGAESSPGGRSPAPGHASSILTGATADGFGIGLIGIAILLHCILLWRRMGPLRRWTGAGLVAGCLVIAGGGILAIVG